MSAKHVRHGVVALVVMFLHVGIVAVFQPVVSLGQLALRHRQLGLISTLHSSDTMLLLFLGSDETERSLVRQKQVTGALQEVRLAVVEPQTIDWPDAESDVAATVQSKLLQMGEQKVLCEVHVHQSQFGQVQSVDFGECTGDSAWQRSLLSSIARAARLLSRHDDVVFPPVRTMILDTAVPSPEMLAQQLSQPLAQ